MQSKYTPLGIIGVILIVAGFLIWAIMTQFSAYSVVPLALGGVLILAYALINVNFLSQTLTKRAAVEGANMAVGVIIVLAIVVFLQMILSKYSTRFDLTESKKYSLSTQTTQMLKGLKEELTLQYLINPSSPGDTQRAKELMELYKFKSDKIKMELFDPEKDPVKVKALGPVTLNTIYVRKGTGEQHEKVSPIEENALTNAIMKLVKGGGRVIYFTAGHEEHPFTDDTDRDGLSGIKKFLTEEGYEVKDLQLASSDTVPDDAVAVVIAGPQRPFFETELQTVENYLKFGGRLLVMLDPENQSGLDKFLTEKYGVVFGNNYVVDNNPLMRLFGGGNPLSPMIGATEAHPIVDAFKEGVPAMPFPIAQSVKLAEPLTGGEQGTVFIKTGKTAWGETDISGLKSTQTAKFDQGADEEGPVGLGVALTKPAEAKIASATQAEATPEVQAGEEKNEEKPEMRLVVFGDSDFATNKLVNNSYDLFVNSINWLAKQEDLISIRPKDDAGQPVMINSVNASFIFYTSLVILPLFVAAIGIAITVSRRLRG